MKNLFSAEDKMGTQHLQEMGNEMQKHGSKEKTGFMEKEAQFVQQLKKVQHYHLETCITLMRIAICAFFIELIFSLAAMFYFGCLFGDCQNGLVCFVHYIKFV